MKNISPKKYAISLYESIKEVKRGKISEVIKGFVKLIAINKDIGKANKIIKAFIEYYNDHENILEVTVSTARPLESRDKESIIKILNSSFDKEIELTDNVDDTLIGGIVLKYGDYIADGSVKKQISLLADSLK